MWWNENPFKNKNITGEINKKKRLDTQSLSKTWKALKYEAR